ncbi:ADP-ribosylglycohydrolase [Izhakiella australiensis]|uniref:ADP-ribosylglycohydrolase n=1 Tax=Izhakiella australiensis TaxID=1926881 RepID=A0A1S8YD01_9GAMM|nr:ADP-ribosylglycohydrolase family protein [Izhakiella australiensis]OON36999.1 ADP-ribosylglycohydrolase [Izhakiella australiensis]
MTHYDKTLGCLIGAAAGDAMGAATEVRTQRQIQALFGGWVTTFQKPPADTFGRCNEAGMCTDDFIQARYIMEAMLAHGGQATPAAMKQAFQRWLEYPFYANFTGPTTRAAMKAIFNDTRESLQGELEGDKQSVQIINGGNAAATNGSAMKIWPAALLHPDNLDDAIQCALDIARFTHNNLLAMSGSAAVAAAVSEAFSQSASTESIIAAGIYGADKGLALADAQGAQEIAGPSVGRRIELAVAIGKRHRSWQTAIVELSDLIGTGLHVSEAVPAAFGLFACCADSPVDAIISAVNIGNDTDTIAAMAGAIAGARHGAAAFPADYLATLNRMNNFSLEALASQIVT